MLNGWAIRKQAQRAHPTMTGCERCGSTNRLQRHHPDYTQPTTIIVLCQTCHVKADMEDGSRRKRQPKACTVCGTTFTQYSHSRVKCCSKDCLSELGRRNAQKRWGTRGSSSQTSPVLPPA